MSVEFTRGLAVLASLTALAGAAAAYYLWSAPAPGPLERPLIAWEPPPVAAGGPASGPSTAASFPETFARPLFAPNRRPFAPPPAPDEAPPPEPPPGVVVLQPQPALEADAAGLTLKGVMIGDTAARALILSTAAAASQWFTLGSDVQGFKLVAIEDDRVILEAGPRKVELKLYTGRPEN